MIIFPAIDLLKGQVVRLKQGEFGSVTVYASDPFEIAKEYAATGAGWLHLVDLDAAKDSGSKQTESIAKIAQISGLKLQVGGGIRTEKDVENLLNLGAHRVIIGSLAVKDPEALVKILSRFGPEKVVLAADIKIENGRMCFLQEGWQKSSDLDPLEIIRFFAQKGLKYLLSTDISKDGMLSGASIELYQSLSTYFPSLDLIASGGVSSLDDLKSLRFHKIYGAIIGKALYEKKFSLEQALKC